MAQVEYARHGKVWFLSRQQVLEYLMSLQKADILYYGNLIRSLADKPCSNEEFKKVKDAHMVEKDEQNRVLEKLKEDLRHREEEINYLTEQLKTKQEFKAYLTDIGGTVSEKDKENMIKQVKLDFERKENELKGDLEVMNLKNQQTSALESKRVAEKVEEIKVLKNEKETEVNRVRAEKEKEISMFRKEKAAEIKQVREEKEKEIQRLTNEKHAEVNRVTQEKQIEIAKLQKTMDNLSEKIESFAGTQKSSANLGKQGEDYLYDAVRGSGCFKLVERVSNKGGRGDLVLKLHTHPDKQIVVDCKNRERPIQRPEKERFQKDLDENDSYFCGMIVSLKCRVDPNVDAFVIQRSKAGKPYLYVNDFKSYPGAAILLQVACLSLLNNVEHHEDDAPFRNFITPHLAHLTALLKTSKELKTKASDLEKTAKEILDNAKKVATDMNISPKPSSSTGTKRSKMDNGEHSDEKRARKVQQTMQSCLQGAQSTANEEHMDK